jgi:hypothetical protein
MCQTIGPEEAPGKAYRAEEDVQAFNVAGKVEEYVPRLVLERTGLMLSKAAALF